MKRLKEKIKNFNSNVDDLGIQAQAQAFKKKITIWGIVLSLIAFGGIIAGIVVFFSMIDFTAEITKTLSTFLIAFLIFAISAIILVIGMVLIKNAFTILIKPRTLIKTQKMEKVGNTGFNNIESNGFNEIKSNGFNETKSNGFNNIKANGFNNQTKSNGFNQQGGNGFNKQTGGGFNAVNNKTEGKFDQAVAEHDGKVKKDRAEFETPIPKPKD